ncbi:zinc finger BED domain-containing protein RICESLEEPER 2-like [Phragmites australis]|uniref:zinc finger BED domain-containing protein RICESLEEPER 2-like n=1 Tax=Phragmites australis TaxID=29695 RepID=UPI002D781AB9|nr:zinc finger BED domain-containing protein RICESLEEPER 2-like [Phragmites australis]
MSSEPDVGIGVGDGGIEDGAEKNSENEMVQITEGEEKEGEGGNEKNARKLMASRSEMWEHFIKIKDDNGVVNKGKCKYCQHQIAADTTINGTSSICMHFNTCKCNPHKFNKYPKHGTLQATYGQGISIWKFDPEALRQAFAEMVIEDELSFVFGEKAGFKKFMSIACPHFNSPSRRTCTRDIFHKVISFFQVKGYKGDDIGKNLHRCLVEWGLDKVMTLTINNAYLKKQLNNAKTIILGGKFLHMRCAAHIVNLIVQDGLKEVDASVKCVRGAIRYIKNGASRLIKFKEFAEEEKVDNKVFLNLNICTRWNSTYLMLKAAITYEKVFARYLDEDPYYAIDLDEDLYYAIV